MKVGFIGQGYVGKNYADDFERRGYDVTRYSLEELYNGNKAKIRECDMVIIAVPTPTTPAGFDDSIIQNVVPLVGAGKIAVIKSTVLPGTTQKLQKLFPDRIVLFSPEFLSEATAAEDTAHPFASIVGMPVEDKAHRDAAQTVLSVMPKAPYSLVCLSVEAEIIKYTHNTNGYMQIVFFNALYDLAQKMGATWDVVEPALRADPYIANRYANPVHKNGRGAGGNCFIKDYAALRGLYEKEVGDQKGVALLRAIEEKNRELLTQTKKDLSLLKGVYGV